MDEALARFVEAVLLALVARLDAEQFQVDPQGADLPGVCSHSGGIAVPPVRREVLVDQPLVRLVVAEDDEVRTERVQFQEAPWGSVAVWHELRELILDPVGETVPIGLVLNGGFGVTGHANGSHSGLQKVDKRNACHFYYTAKF